jgi:ribosomal protein S8
MTDDRRRFFRINDEAEISFKTITDEKYQEWKHGQGNGESNEDEEGNALTKLNSEINMTLAHLKNQQPESAKICELLNQKIDLALKSNHEAHGFIDNNELKAINLSACGIAFHTDQFIPENENILLQLKLKPSNIAIMTTGKVVHVEQGQSENVVRVDFQNLGDNNQDILIQHLFQVQRRELKKQRDNN